MKFSFIQRIISGGQTGADRAAMDFALRNGIEIGGYVPHGRMAEDGPINERYRGLTETVSSDPAVRTELNVLAAEATLVFSHGSLSGGSLLTLEFARRHGRPFFHADLQNERSGVVRSVTAWLDSLRPTTLNVAGPRSSEDSAIYDAVYEFLEELFGD